jgi:hypothetical protein
MNLQDVINTEAGNYINSFSAQVTGSKALETKTGKAMYVASAHDGNLSIDLTSFDIDFRPYEGQMVQFSGKGIKRDEYNGKAKLMIGRGVVVKTSTGGSAAPSTTPAKAPVAAFDAAAYMESLVQYRILCEQAAQQVAADFDGAIGPDHLQAIASGFFISLSRKVGL